MIDYRAIGKRIRIYRHNTGITQESLAEKINVSPPYISRIETGSASPSLQTLIDICNALDVTIDDLMQDSLPAAKLRFSRQLEELLADCSPAELKFLTNVIPALLREIRNLPVG